MCEYVKSMYRSYMNVKEMPVIEYELFLVLEDDHKDEVNSDE